MNRMTLDEALDYYLEVRTSNRRADIIAACQEAARRRSEGPQATRAVLRAMRDELAMSVRAIETASWNPHTGDRIARSTIDRLLHDEN